MKTLIGLLALLLCGGVLAVEETDVEEEGLPTEQINPSGDLGVTGNGSLELITPNDLSQASTAATVCPTKVVFGKPTLLPMVPNCGYGSTQCPEKPGWYHTGIDYIGAGEALAVADGTVVWVEAANPNDHGMGTNVIVKHILAGPRCSALYSSYSNLASLNVQVDQPVVKGQSLGLIANALHFELKADAATGNPWGIGQQNGSCQARPWQAQANTCWRFTKGGPTNLGYLNPGLYLNKTITQPTYRQVSAGGYHTCAVQPDGALTCWGGNNSGQATPPSGAFKTVSSGYEHTCGVRSDGAVVCWGSNEYGAATPPTGIFKSVSAGVFHTCGVRTDSTVACWGWNGHGQATPPAGTFNSVSAGYGHTCGVRSDGTVACWGANGAGGIMPPSGAFNSVSAGNVRTCGVRSDGAVACWGDNSEGRATPPPLE